MTEPSAQPTFTWQLQTAAAAKFDAELAYVTNGFAWNADYNLVLPEKGQTLDVVPRYLITGRRVAGSSFGGVKGRDQVPQLVERWLAGDIDVEPFVSHKLTLDEVNRGFELMERQDGIRSVIRFS